MPRSPGAARPLARPASRPSFQEALRFWTRLGFISFGGPAGQIAVMHRELVERRGWIDESRFLHALDYCMLLPGPEAQQLAVYLGWWLHGARGGVAAGVLFVLPSALILWALSWFYAVWHEVTWVAGPLLGLQAAVTAIVASAVVRIARRALRGPAAWALAVASFAGIYFLGVPFPAVVLGAAAIGFVAGVGWPGAFAAGGHGVDGPSASGAADRREDRDGPPTRARALRVLAVHVILWFAPVVVAAALLGPDHLLVQQGLFFSKAALVTFGGAYAVLPYVAQQAVERFGWLGAPQMLVGMGLAETTPGPLIMVLQFVGFLGGWNHPEPFSPLVAATLSAAMTTWTTFVPCFLFILTGAPWVERLRGSERLSSALGAITAAVVGVILNLAVWFGLRVIFPANGIDPFALLVAVVSLWGLTRRGWEIPAVVAGAAAAGLVRSFTSG